MIKAGKFMKVKTNQVIKQILPSRSFLYSTPGPVLCTASEGFEIVRKSGESKND